MPRYAAVIDVGGKSARIVIDSDTPPTEDQILEEYDKYQGQQTTAQPSQPKASFGDLRMREDQMPQPQAPIQQPSLTPRTDEASNSVRFIGGGGLGGGIPSGFGVQPFTVPPEAIAEVGTQAIRYGAPIAAGMLLPPAGAIATAAAIGASAGAGELAAQAAEIGRGKRETIEPGQVASSTVLGATPFNVLQGLGGPLKSAAVNAIKQAAVSQATSALADVFDTALSEGRFPTQKEITDSTLQLSTYLPGAVGGLVGGAAGFASRPVRALTQEEQIGRAAKEAGRRIEGVVGQGQAPLTAAQQTGRNLPGEFSAGSGELAAQQAVPGRVREAIGQAPAGASMAAERELAAASEAASQRLAGQVGATQRGGEALVEAQLQTSIPGSVRTASNADSATKAVQSIIDQEQLLTNEVKAAYAPYEDAVKRLTRRDIYTGKIEGFVPVKLQAAIDDVLGSLANVSRTKRVTFSAPASQQAVPQVQAGGYPGVPTSSTQAQSYGSTSVSVPSTQAIALSNEQVGLFDQASALANRLKDASRNAQTVDQIIGMRRQIDDAFSDITEIAPGFGKAQLTKLRNALKEDELAAARNLGPEAEKALVSAQKVAENRFKLLEDNPLIVKALRPSSEANSFQNAEDLFSEIAKKPAAFESLKKLLPADKFSEIRRGLFDSLRDIKTLDINGVKFENAEVLANNFRNLPSSTRDVLAGSKVLANDLQGVLDDVAKAQSVGRTVPVYGGIKEDALNRAFTEAGAIKDPALRGEIIKDVNAAVNRARQYENEITAQARARTLNPNINEDEFVRNFVLSSNNPAIVRDAMAQLTPATRQAVSKKAAEVFVDHIISSSKTANSLDELIGDKNRLQIVREVMSPNDLELAQDLMKWQRGVLMTGPQGKLDSSELAKFVWKVTQARALTDLMVGNAAMQNFISVLAKTPRAVLSLKPTISTATAQRAATGVGAPMLTEIEKAAEEARASLPEQLITTFNQAFGFSK